MRPNVIHATPSADKPLGHHEWDAAHNVTLTAHNLGNISSYTVISVSNGPIQRGTLTSNVNIALPALAGDAAEDIVLLLKQDASGGHNITFDGVSWVGGIPYPTVTEPNQINMIRLIGTADGWVGINPSSSGGGGGGGSSWSTRILTETNALSDNTSNSYWFPDDFGVLLLENSTYEIEGYFRSLNGTTSHGLNMSFENIQEASIEWSSQGAKVAANGQATALRFGASNTFTTNRLVTTASTVAGNIVHIKGIVRTTYWGNLRPRVAQSASSGSFVVQPGTFFRVQRIGSNTYERDPNWSE